MAAARGILDGVRVVELATVIAGPTTAALLRDMGASVVKVEPPEGDSYRYMGVNPARKRTRYGELWGSGFEHCNRGKQSVVLDFSVPEDLDAMRRLLAEADVFVTNVRAKGLKNLGLDFATLHAKHPRLIYAHLTAWGLGGPDEDYPGYDVGAFWAASGLMKYTAPSDEVSGLPPRFPGGLGDQTTAIHLMAGVLGALYDRSNTGQGQLVEACLYRAGIWTMGLPITTALTLRDTTSGKEKLVAPTQADFGNPGYNSYPCKDGWMQLLGLDLERHIGGILEAVDPDGQIRSAAPFAGSIKDLCRTLNTDARSRRRFIQLLNDCFRAKTTAEWEAIFRKKDVWHHTVSDVNDVVNDAQANAIGTFFDVGAAHKLLSHPVKWSNATTQPRGRAPALGADTEAVLRRGPGNSKL